MRNDLVQVRQTYAEVTASQRRLASSKEQLDAQAGNIDALYEGMTALERKIMEANSKKDQMKARVRTAKTTQKVNDMVSGLTGRTSMDAFNRMEEKVLALEAAAEVSADIAKNIMNKALAPSTLNKGSASDIEMQFRLLESSESVDIELEKLRANILPSSSSKKSVAVERIIVEDSTMDR